ncbi:Hypothetical predicted protein [Prunus dulcis]|uniref:Uncharacterized protein n=1 Tax=Prunus dulcis TaxID=3755 RepID=A0A5E4FXU9_PRUDU|nr:Hypothetical predicted protein [Prunus dulcis]
MRAELTTELNTARYTNKSSPGALGIGIPFEVYNLLNLSNLQVSKQVIHKFLDIFCEHGMWVILVAFRIWAALTDFLIDLQVLTFLVVLPVWRIGGLLLQGIPYGLSIGIGSSGTSCEAPFFVNLIVMAVRLTFLKAEPLMNISLWTRPARMPGH